MTPSNNNRSTRSASTKRSSTATVAGGAIAALLACNACPAQAFQPGFFVHTPHVLHRSRAVAQPSMPAATTMRYFSPWDADCGGMMQPFHPPRGRIGRRGRMFSPPGQGLFRDMNLQIKDPKVLDTKDGYQLTFDLPADLDTDGFDVAVSDRLVTVTAKMTRELSPAAAGRTGWVSRSSRTDSVSRTFVLPEGVSGAGVSTSQALDGKIQVNFNKDTSFVNREGSPADRDQTTTRPSAVSSSAEYLAGLASSTKTASSSVADPTPPVSASSTETPRVPPSEETPASPANQRQERPRSVFDAVDKEFGDFAKAFWGEDVLRFPTQEEMAAKVEAAREARAKQVLAMRRATMAASVSETQDGSYLVRVDLPQGARRSEVSLTVTGDSTLRVTYAAKDRRSVYRDVRLPRDARFADVVAKLEQDGANEPFGSDQAVANAEDRVSSLQVTVGRTAPTQPQRIDIA